MNKTLKGAVAVMLAVIMVFGGAPAGALAGLNLSWPEWLKSPFLLNASAEDYSGSCGANLTWSLNGTTGALTISGTGAMYDWLSSSTPWYSYRSSIRSISIGNGVTSIGNHAFFDCGSLTSVTIPDSVTSIGGYAFWGCGSITSVTIPDSVMCIGNYAFTSCYRLTSITIPDSVTSIGDWAFSGCIFTSITIPYSVTSIGALSFYCSSLTIITVDNANQYYSNDSYGVLFNKDKTTLIQYPAGNSRTSYEIPDSVTSIGYGAFRNCITLTSVTIPDSVTSIGDEAFNYCEGLTSASIGNSVTSIGNSAFKSCKGLTEITIPDSVTSIGDSAFQSCYGLTNITIPDSVTNIGDWAFSGCNFTSITIPYSVMSIGVLSFSCSGLTIITVDDANQYYSSDSYGVLFNKNKTALIQYPVGDTRSSYKVPNSVTSIGDWAFCGCLSLTSVTIPASVTSIGEWAFFECDHLMSITIPNGVTSIGNRAFSGCDRFMSVTIPGSVTSIGDEAFSDCMRLDIVSIGNGVTNIGNYAFQYCGHLTSITIPNSVMSIGDGAFSECNWLTSVTIPDSVTSIRKRTFEGCDSLTSITIPDNVTSIGDRAFCNCGITSITIPENVTSIGDLAFSSCGITSITIPENVTSIGKTALSGCDKLTNITADNANQFYSSDSNGVLFNKDKTTLIQYPVGNARTSYEVPDSVTIIGIGAFSSCQSLTSVTIPYSVTSIGGSAFSYCQSLTSVSIGNSVTSIGNSAFQSCYGLTGIEIPDSVISLGNYAFGSCYRLTGITIPDSVTSIGSYAFNGCSKLASVLIGNSVTSIGDSAFYKCSFTSITIPDSVTSIGNKIFDYCIELTNIKVDNANQFYSSDSYGVLFNKDKTTLVQYPIGSARTSYKVPNSVTSIGSDAFSSCDYLESMIIGNFVTSIGVWAFSSCDNLTRVTIPDSVTSIGNYSFYLCSCFTDVYYSGSETEWNAISIGTNNTPMTSATIHYNTVPVTGVSLDAESLALIEGDTSQLNATVEPSNATDLSVTWSSSDENVATVDSTGLVDAVAEGTATITVTANDTINGTIIDTCELKVIPITLISIDINILPSKTSYYVGDTLDTSGLTLAAIYNNDTSEMISSGFNCSPSTLETAGTQTVTVTYRGVSCSFDVTVSRTDASNFNVAAIPDQNYNGKYIMPALTIVCRGKTLENAKDYITQYSNNKNVGEATVEITGIGNYCGTVTVTFNIIYIAANGIGLSNKTLSLNVSESQKLKVLFNPTNATNKKVTWLSSDTAVAVVDTYGNVTAKGRGKATITATSQDGGYTTKCTVTVKLAWWQWLIKIILFGWIWY